MRHLQVDLAVKLGLPLLAPHPSIARHFSLKSGAKQLFRSAKVNVAPGVELDPRPPGPAQAFGQSLSTSHPAPPPPHTPASTSFTFITCLSLPRVFTLLHSNLCHSIKHMFLCALPSIA